MKIRPSLKLYFLVSILVTGVVTIATMAYVSYYFYFSGIDFAMSDAMKKNAYQLVVSDEKPQEINGFTVATRWQDLPAAVQKNLKESDLVEDKLLKSVAGNPLLGPTPAGYFALKLNNHGDIRYVSSMFVTEFATQERPRGPPEFFYIFAIAFVAIGLFSLVPILLLRKVAIPVEHLTTWAKNLDQDELSKPAPKFHYSELDSLAQIVRTSLHCVQESVAREKLFLGYASHELRTPIAVMRSNSELLRKMIDKDIPKTRQLEVLERIERASLTMTDLTETLLWLNRHSDQSLPNSQFSLDEMIAQLAAELAYLLSGKQVEVTINCEATTLNQPKALCRIVITNLIRNAFQHTYAGKVDIQLSGGKLALINTNELSAENNHELGFGLGLELTERLIAQQGWDYSNQETGAGRHVLIKFQK